MFKARNDRKWKCMFAIFNNINDLKNALRMIKIRRENDWFIWYGKKEFALTDFCINYMLSIGRSHVVRYRVLIPYRRLELTAPANNKSVLLNT